MKIRSITLGTGVDAGLAPALERAGRLLADLGKRFSGAGYEVQTTRISLPPLVGLAGLEGDLPKLVEQIEARIAAAGVGYAALGPIRWRDDAATAERLAAALPAALAAGERG